MARVTTRYRAACTTLRVETRRNAEIVPTTASPMNAPSWGDMRLGAPRLFAGLDHRGAPGLPLGHPPIRSAAEPLGHDATERGLVELDLDAFAANPLPRGQHRVLTRRG